MNLVDILENAKNSVPDKEFLKYGKEKLTFGGFYEKAGKFAAGLKELGVKKGDRVALLLSNSFEFVIAYFGTVILGAEVIPLNTFLRLEEVVYILNDSRTKVFITSAEFNELLKQLSPNRVQSLEKIIGVGEVECPDCVKFEDVYGKDACGKADITDDDVAVIIYTSGTTGHPKGVMLTHKNLISNVESSKDAIHIKDNDKFILFLPMFHAFSFTVCVLLPLYKKCHLTVIKSIQPFGKIIKALVADGITVFVAIPQVYNVLAGKKFSRLGLFIFGLICKVRVCISGAAPLAGEVLKKFEERFKVPLMEGYGLSETSPVVSVNPLDGVRKAGSVGPPVPRVTVKAIDDNGKVITDGSPGELLVKGPNVMKGYFNKKEETDEILKDGWLHTGDIAKIDEDGYIFIVDRKKDLILVNGMNLYPREVEEVLYTHPAVADAAVVGKKEPAHGEIPIGIIKLKENASVTDAELKKFCRPLLANFKVPHRFEFWDELPRNGTGKIMKKEIKKAINEKDGK